MEFATEGFKHESFPISKGASSLPSYDLVPLFFTLSLISSLCGSRIEEQRNSTEA